MLTVLRAYHYAPRKAGLLTRAVLPFLDDLRRAEGHEVAFVTRHWDGGSHLALHLGPGPVRADAAALLGERAAALGEPGEAWSEAEYAARRREYEAVEERTARHASPFPHGTVRADVQDDPAPLEAVRHAMLTGLTRVLADADESGPGLVLQLMLAAGSVFPGGLRFGSLSYRSHAEAYLAASPHEHPLRERFEQAYQQRAGALDQLVADALATPAALPAYGTFAQAYARLREPDLDGPVRALLGAADETAALPQPGRMSAFHATLQHSGFHSRPPEGFLPYRVLVNWLYELLPVLDVTTVHRYLYCYCTARAVDERLGEAWQDRLKTRPN
ncbi:lantibiotic dehydratase C-terminal domain-containing protein [Streptomyces sp. NPDC049585]|uniref:lantibiotic dehydratase C-terminal domain-containing protein n=1 Tax=Streptomyces sp. NPDC049585 TaxID=3155154 RepID=UPI0034438B7C